MEGLSVVSPAVGTGGAVETLICIIVAMVVLRLELQRRTSGGTEFGSPVGRRYAESCKRVLREFAPEAAGIIACLTLAAALRARGDTQPVDDEAWERIKEQWPLLMTADTLLSLQAMLRLLVLLSVLLRGDGGSPAPLSDWAAALWLGAGVARVALMTRTSVYMLDGPVGGALPAACEVAVLPLLLVLGRSALRRAPGTAAMVLAAATCFAYRNRLNLAEDAVTDSLFSLAHSLEFLASFVYLLRTALTDLRSGNPLTDISVAFTHLLMPIQQALASYYFLEAFDAAPAIVGAGHPVELLKIGCTAQLGAYLGAAALYFAECCEGESGGR